MKWALWVVAHLKPCLAVLALMLVLSISALQGEASAECRITSGDAASVTYSQGILKDDICDTHGYKPVTIEEFNICLSGESNCIADSPTSYIMVRTVLLSSGIKTADAQIKASAGYVSHMICQGVDAAATAGTIILHDALTETGTAVFTFTVAALDYHTPMVFPIQTNFATGIYLGYTTTGDISCTVYYQ